VDCRDRLAFWLLELVLEPVRELAINGEGGSVTVRAARGERRFDLTIARGDGDYSWSFREVAGPGRAEPPSPLQDQAVEPLFDPEHAFWAGWGAIEEVVELTPPISDHARAAA
jgi:hypothetical protein